MASGAPTGDVTLIADIDEVIGRMIRGDQQYAAAGLSGRFCQAKAVTTRSCGKRLKRGHRQAHAASAGTGTDPLMLREVDGKVPQSCCILEKSRKNLVNI